MKWPWHLARNKGPPPRMEVVVHGSPAAGIRGESRPTSNSERQPKKAQFARIRNDFIGLAMFAG